MKTEQNTDDNEVTYRYNPTADIFIQHDFSPEENKNAAIPERLSLQRGNVFFSVRYLEIKMLVVSVFTLTSNSSVR